MNKLVAIIALGAATANATGYKYTYAPFEDSPNDYFDFAMTVLSDAHYTTTYTGGKDDSQSSGL
jgi:hypothetical protein